jgi:hypothetical protein
LTNINDRFGLTIPAAGASLPSQATFCVPLVSGVYGTLCEKHLPCGQMGDDVRIELTFEGQTTAVCYSSAAAPAAHLCTGNNGYARGISNLELELCIVELSDEGIAMVNEVTPFHEPVYIHSSSYRHFVSNLAAGTTGMYTTLVPARFSSLKSVHLCYILLQPKHILYLVVLILKLHLCVIDYLHF